MTERVDGRSAADGDGSPDGVPGTTAGPRVRAEEPAPPADAPPADAPHEDAAAPTGGPLSARYLAFVSATGLSSLGDAAWVIALTVTLTRLSDAAVAGAVMALSGVPRVLAMLGGGAMADRRGARWTMIRTDLLRCLVMLVAAGAVYVWAPSIPLLVCLAALLAFLGSFFVPASGALRPRLLPERHLVRGNALYLIGLRSGQAAGGPVGAWLLGLGGLVAVALVNAGSFLLSAFATLRCAPRSIDRTTVRPADDEADGPAPPPASTLHRIAEGVRYVLGNHRLTVLMGVVALTELAGAGPLNIGLILISDRMGESASGAGLLLTGYTVGTTVTFLAGLVLPVGRRAGVVALAAMAGSGIALAAIGHSGELGVTVALYGLFGACSAQAGLVLVSLVQRLLPDHARARVMSIMSLLIFGAVPIGNLTTGVMIQWLGVPTTLTVQALLSLAGAALFAGDRALRRSSLE
ncbi:MFS transporter [Streptomyces sp. NPDC008150]|uniref:MFS transporter n=1 Tax=Streptomyces sp. NPDC008150 TaxID=3364816 RepID=UPI0036E9E855